MGPSDQRRPARRGAASHGTSPLETTTLRSPGGAVAGISAPQFFWGGGELLRPLHPLLVRALWRAGGVRAGLALRAGDILRVPGPRRRAGGLLRFPLSPALPRRPGFKPVSGLTIHRVLCPDRSDSSGKGFGCLRGVLMITGGRACPRTSLPTRSRSAGEVRPGPTGSGHYLPRDVSDEPSVRRHSHGLCGGPLIQEPCLADTSCQLVF